jgi:putative transposase
MPSRTGCTTASRTSAPMPCTNSPRPCAASTAPSWSKTSTSPGCSRTGARHRRIADAGFGEIRRQLTYKGRRDGAPTVVASRSYPSSKTCSDCGTVKAKLPLHVRVFECDACGLVMDRDENAARNLAALAATCTTGTAVAADWDPQGSKPLGVPRGADHRTRAGRPRRKAEAVRAGGAIPQQRTETGDRHQDAEALTLRRNWAFGRQAAAPGGAG